MIIVLVLLVLICLLWFFFKKKSDSNPTVQTEEDEITDEIETTPVKEILYDENGREYYIQTTTIQIPRNTFIKGVIAGKYRGQLITSEEELHNSKSFGFEIYEAEITCTETRKELPYENTGEVFPREKLPETLQVSLLQSNQWYSLNIIEPKLFLFKSNKKLHQIEGNEIFGTFTAEITGYIIDYVPKVEEELIYVDEIIDEPILLEDEVPDRSNGIETGKTERKGNYIRKEYFTVNHNKIWGSWDYSRSPVKPNSQGCVSSLFGGIAFIIGIIFLLVMLPQLLFVLPFILIPVLFSLFGRFFTWIFRIIGAILLLVFILAFISSITHSTHRNRPAPLIVDTPREARPEIKPMVDSTTNVEVDKIIKHYRVWKDYDDNEYEGSYSLHLSDILNSGRFKNDINLSQSTTDDYDKIIFSLKENDKQKLNGIYKLFDSIGKANSLPKIQFAKMIVSFVQDIPYAIILDKGCDSSLYNDTFTRQYLLNSNAPCDGNQRFGINTPVEFLGNLKGDCDSRTLLLYTLLSHYDYDVALLSSEFYGHSILGINLPINGTAYSYNNQRYVMWETTAPNIRPGIIPNQISNLNNWRISLKSK